MYVFRPPPQNTRGRRGQARKLSRRTRAERVKVDEGLRVPNARFCILEEIPFSYIGSWCFGCELVPNARFYILEEIPFSYLGSWCFGCELCYFESPWVSDASGRIGRCCYLVRSQMDWDGVFVQHNASCGVVHARELLIRRRLGAGVVVDADWPLALNIIWWTAWVCWTKDKERSVY